MVPQMAMQAGRAVEAWQEQLLNALGTYRGPITSILTLIALFLLYKLLKRPIRRYLEARAQKPENVQNFFLIWRYLWIGVGFVLVLIAFSGSLAGLGISAAFLGMILGWSLQAPVTGIAAWLMIILKRPFKIGDRIIISGIVGDVTDINLTHVILNQVGGTIGGEEKSGRGVLIPNATLFQQVIYNYAFETNYILDEVVLNLTFESDLDEAERICLEAARNVTAEIIEGTGQSPFIRAELMDWGLRIRLRYQTLATERQRISSEIAQIVFGEFAGNEKVEFSYPHSEVIHRPKSGGPGMERPPYLETETPCE
jgi:small-conductance mechanosensitive channel